MAGFFLFYNGLYKRHPLLMELGGQLIVYLLEVDRTESLQVHRSGAFQPHEFKSFQWHARADYSAPAPWAGISPSLKGMAPG